NTLGYIHVLVCALFGVIAILGKGPVRWIAVGMVLLTWPYFWFDRARNKMLALLLPALAAYILLGKRSLPVRIGIVALVGLGLTLWFARVMEFRSSGGQLSSFSASGASGTAEPLNELEAKEQQAKTARVTRMGQD